MSIYISIFIILLSILWHSGNDHNVIKPDKIIFSEGWQTVPEYSTHFHFDSFSASQKPGETQPLHVWHEDFLILLYPIKEELFAQQQLASVVFPGYI